MTTPSNDSKRLSEVSSPKSPVCEWISTQHKRDIIDRLGQATGEYFTGVDAQTVTDPRFLFPILDYLPWLLICFVYLDH